MTSKRSNVFFKNQLLYLLLIINNIIAQIILPADPYKIICEEYNDYKNNDIRNLYFRPILTDKNHKWFINLSNQFFYNNGDPNLENMGNRWIGNGFSYFSRLHFSYRGEFFQFGMEPYYFINHNNTNNDLNRPDNFSVLNDQRYFTSSPYKSLGFQETQLYLSLKGITFGLSNANMWWGPGIHTSLTMTNNTKGFPHLMIGTLREKEFLNNGINFRYVFAPLDKLNNDSYFTGILFSTTFNSNPLITIGLNRNILLSKYLNNQKRSMLDVTGIVFNPSSKILDGYQILTSYLIVDFKHSGLKIFFELGTTDLWKNFTDFFNYPDHGIGSIIGLRQYAAFNNENINWGFEYARLAQSSFWDKRPTPNWYENSLFDYSSYEGRRWTAHSGSDSDDLYIFFGYFKNKWSIIKSLNYERHGILYIRPAEVKMEIRIDFRYSWNKYNFNVFYEREWLEHAGFVPDKWRKSNIIWFGVEKNLNEIFSKN